MPTESKKFLEHLKTITNKVTIVNLPLAKELYEGVLIERNLWLDYLRIELAKLDIELIEVGESLPQNYYFDGYHVNKKGRAVRVKQFKEVIEERL